jgi:PAS domain S-box-containing protein
MNFSNSQAIPLPNFSESDIRILKNYFELNKKYYEKINKELMVPLLKHKLWGPILASISPEMQNVQSERSLEIQRAAIYEGKWEKYCNELISQGRMYARINVSYSDWYEIVCMYKVYITPYIKKDFAHSVEEAISFLDGLSKLTDYAMYVIAESYFQEKNSIIRTSEEKFKAIFENSTDNILVVGLDGTIEMINRVEAEYKKEDIVGRKIYDLESDSMASSVKEALQGVFEQNKPTAYNMAVPSSGGPRYYSCTISPIANEDHSVQRAVIISRDITSQKNSEMEIIELNTMLEQKVAERTKELFHINRELESFSYSVSHDLRGPLRAINGFTQILFEECPSEMNEECRDAMDEIISNTKRMGKLIDDLLEFSRLGKKQLQVTKLDMNELVHSVIRDMCKTKSELTVSFDVKQLQKAPGDNDMIKQVIVNLISNAIKYSSKKQTPEIEIGSYGQDKEAVYYVKDNGVGFDMAYYKKLFGVFQRLHRSDEFEGTGVGLAIVQRIIEKHQGKVWAEGAVNKGATFYFSLPNN